MSVGTEKKSTVHIRKGWIRENARIRIVLEVTVSYHQACHGIEIRINSQSGDGSYTWVRMSTDRSKYVMVMSDIMPSKPETLNGGRTREPVATLRSKQTSSETSSCGPKSRTETPIHERKWMDVEPGGYDAQFFFSVSKKMTELLRHELRHL